MLGRAYYFFSSGMDPEIRDREQTRRENNSLGRENKIGPTIGWQVISRMPALQLLSKTISLLN